MGTEKGWWKGSFYSAGCREFTHPYREVWVDWTRTRCAQDEVSMRRAHRQLILQSPERWSLQSKCQFSGAAPTDLTLPWPPNRQEARGPAAAEKQLSVVDLIQTLKAKSFLPPDVPQNLEPHSSDLIKL